MSEQPGRYQRSAAGMVGAMLVCLALIVGFVLLRDINRNEPASPVQPVDYQQTLRAARGQADFPLLAPPSLPKGWEATSVSFVPTPTRWHLGVLTDENKYVGLEQSHDPLNELVKTYVDQNAARGRPVQVDGKSWQSWTDAGGDYALTRVDKGVTTLVVGSAGREVVMRYAASLR